MLSQEQRTVHFLRTTVSLGECHHHHNGQYFDNLKLDSRSRSQHNGQFRTPSKAIVICQVRDHCSSFLYDHPDGKLKKEFFRTMLTQSLKDFSTEELQKLEEHIFRIYDSNGDGVVDFHEFMTVFMILTGDEPRSVLEKIFLIFDVDNSGLITKV